jgi:hypothetical protein
MPSNKDLLGAFRQHLVDQGLVRKASVAVPGKRPVFVEPADGAPAPGEREGVENDDVTMISLFVGGDIAGAAFEGFIAKSTIDVRYRTHDAQEVLDLAAAVRLAIVDQWDWLMGGLRVIESREWAGVQRVGSSAAQGYDFVHKFYFEYYSG